MDEIITAITGCVEMLEELSEESPDNRIWTMIAALKWSAERLDEMDESCHGKKES